MSDRARQDYPRRACPSQDRETIKRLAIRYSRDEIFTHRDIRANDLELEIQIFRTTFLPLMGGLAAFEESTVGLVYARREDALTLYVRGHPVFDTCHLLNIEDAEQFWSYVSQIESALLL